jgi:hypothetical protein
MPVHAYLAGAWRQAKVVWHWNGSAWIKASKVFIYQFGAWQQGYQRPSFVSVVGNNDSGSPNDLIFDWTTSGDTYGAYVTFTRNGTAEGLSSYPLDTYPTGTTLGGYDPTGTWSVRMHDGNNDIVSSSNVFF